MRVTLDFTPYLQMIFFYNEFYAMSYTFIFLL